MKSNRPYLNLVLPGVVSLLLASNCVIKTSTDSISCNPGDQRTCNCGNLVGVQACKSSGDAYTDCVCSDTGSGGASGSGSGGTSGGNTGGTTGGSSGTPSTGGDAGDTGLAGATGDAGSSGLDPCDECLATACNAELNFCLSNDNCIASDGSGTGQFEQVITCVETLRVTQAVKRPDLRDCGNAALSAAAGSEWPPQGMDPDTTNLINCMATGQTTVSNNNSWADPVNIDSAWPNDSCAHLACTAQAQ